MTAYAERFSGRARVELAHGGVPPQYANAVPRTVRAACILELYTTRVTLAAIRAYHRRFHGGIIHLTRAGVAPKIANAYDARFRASDVARLHVAGIDVAGASAYPQQLSSGQIIELRVAEAHAHVGSQACNRFGADGLAILDRAGVRLLTALGYHERFDALDVAALIRACCDPSTAEGYHARFDGVAIGSLIAQNISARAANDFPSHLLPRDIAHLVRHEVCPTLAARYPRSMGAYSIVRRCRLDTLGESYDPRFSEAVALELASHGVAPSRARLFHPRFSGFDIVALCSTTISPEAAARYDVRFNGSDIATLHGSGISPEEAATYDERFGAHEVARMVEAEVPPGVAASYPKRFTGHDIAVLRLPRLAYDTYERSVEEFNVCDLGIAPQQRPISPRRASKFPGRFDGGDIVHLDAYGVPPSLACEYEDDLSGFHIGRLHAHGVGPDQARRERHEYQARFRDSVPWLQALGVRPPSANAYHRRFSAADVVLLNNDEFFDPVPPHVANAYPTRLPADQIRSLVIEGVSAEETIQLIDRVGVGRLGAALARIRSRGSTPRGVAE